MISNNGDTRFAVLEAVVEWWETARFGPTVEEVRVEVGLGVRSSVQHHINNLLEDGLVENIPRKHRTLRPTDKGVRMVELMKSIDSA